MGGAAKVYKLFCHFCPLTSKNIAKPNESNEICIKCKVKHQIRPTWKFFHQDFSSNELKEKYEASLNHLQKQWTQDMEKIWKDGKLKLRDSQYKDSIDYIPANMDKSVQMIGLLMTEMRIRNRSPAGKSVPQIRQKIK